MLLRNMFSTTDLTLTYLIEHVGAGGLQGHQGQHGLVEVVVLPDLVQDLKLRLLGVTNGVTEALNLH